MPALRTGLPYPQRHSNQAHQRSNQVSQQGESASAAGPRLKILFAGPLAPWNSTYARRRALVDLGHSVTTVDLLHYRSPGPGLAKKLVRHLHVGPGVAAYN